MLKSMLAAGLLVLLAATGASAQPAVSLTGTYRCMQGCAPGFEGKPAFVTQSGWNINIVTEAGVSVQAWFDWGANDSNLDGGLASRCGVFS